MQPDGRRAERGYAYPGDAEGACSGDLWLVRDSLTSQPIQKIGATVPITPVNPKCPSCMKYLRPIGGTALSGVNMKKLLTVLQGEKLLMLCCGNCDVVLGIIPAGE